MGTTVGVPAVAGIASSVHCTVTSVRRLAWSWRRPSTTAHSRAGPVVEEPSEVEAHETNHAPRPTGTEGASIGDTTRTTVWRWPGRSGATAPCGAPCGTLVSW